MSDYKDKKDEKEGKSDALRATIIKVIRDGALRLLDLAQTHTEDAEIRERSPIFEPFEEETAAELALEIAASIYRVFPYFAIDRTTKRSALSDPVIGRIEPAYEIFEDPANVTFDDENPFGTGIYFHLLNWNRQFESDDPIADEQIIHLSEMIVDAYGALAKPKRKKKKSKE